MHQNEANVETSIQKAENALSGALNLPNLADPNIWGMASGPGVPDAPGNGTMTFNIPGVINVSQAAGSSFGSFTPDEQMPGIPGTTGSTDGFAVEIKTFLELSRGFYRMGVNSDDGFQTKAGFLNDRPLILGTFDGGRVGRGHAVQFRRRGIRRLRLPDGLFSRPLAMLRSSGSSSSRMARNCCSMTRPTAVRRPISRGQCPTSPSRTYASPSRKTPTARFCSNGRPAPSRLPTLVTGTYQTVTGATSPYTITPGEAHKFYRVLVR